MEKLTTMHCEACRVGAPLVTEAEIKVLHAQIPHWNIIQENNINRLQRVFKFNNFAEALTFTNKAGALAEENGHHPDILTAYGQVTITWWSHKIKGLHKNDFIMAAKTDELQ
ncbi:pterin-4-alpha-carbinolamine dehydratase [Candidatus Nitrosoglobus terrae]|uniref:Putative pterin-4-alpha-carbinolamine dehydratase n=1 Tax=Candidatus Nitrosoglobus terrae TaxID=1630141 RepID=A0A1Q2SK80_9GAMM|nr:4a-hydroxytetrahydrobiopterin dehydratase [Candidatus Nitrosoglobus terrae]BAW79551.1 pterin-4-alpha-carbinolamine dehydratase [Candidatus Nitrosoglobus terrae]